MPQSEIISSQEIPVSLLFDTKNRGRGVAVINFPTESFDSHLGSSSICLENSRSSKTKPKCLE